MKMPATKVIRTIGIVLLFGVVVVISAAAMSKVNHPGVADPGPVSLAANSAVHESPSSNGIRLSPETVKSLHIETKEVVPARYSRTLELSGSTAPDTNRLVRIRSLFAGKVVEIGENGQRKTDSQGQQQEFDRRIRDGDLVREGDLLAVILSKDLGEKKSQLLTALSQLRLHEETLVRLEELLLKGGIPERNVLESRQLVESDRIAVALAERTLRSWQLSEKDIQDVYDEADRSRHHKDQLARIRDLGDRKVPLKEALNRQWLAEDELERLRDLATKVVVSKGEVQAGERSVAAARTAVKRAKSVLNMQGASESQVQAIEEEAAHVRHEKRWAMVEIRAPFDGVILEKNLALGDAVDTSTILYQIGDLSRLGAWVYAYEDDVHTLQNLMNLPPEERKWKIRLKSDPQGEALEGTINEIRPAIDPTMHAALVKGQVTNQKTKELPRGRLLVGQFITASIEVPIAPEKEEVEIPINALVEDGRDSVVFVQPDPQNPYFEMRRVAVVRRFGRVHQTAPVVTSSPTAAERPMIGVAALLQLVDWYRARTQRNQQGGSSCVNREPPLSPPAPDQAKASDQTLSTVAGPACRKPQAHSERAQPRRRRTPHEATCSSGGDA